jgi:hypothetical protein
MFPPVKMCPALLSDSNITPTNFDSFFKAFL